MCFAFVLCVRMVAREQWKLVHKTELVTKTKRKRGRAAKSYWGVTKGLSTLREACQAL